MVLDRCCKESHYQSMWNIINNLLIRPINGSYKFFLKKRSFDDCVTISVRTSYFEYEFTLMNHD